MPPSTAERGTAIPFCSAPRSTDRHPPARDDLLATGHPISSRPCPTYESKTLPVAVWRLRQGRAAPHAWHPGHQTRTSLADLQLVMNILCLVSCQVECDVYYSYHMYLTLDKTSVTKYEYIYVSVFHLSKQEYLIKSLAIISKQASKCPKLTLASARALFPAIIIPFLSGPC